MAKKGWTFTLRDRRHTVELDHGYLSGKTCITVDGERIERSRKIGTGSVHNFQVSGVPCVLEIIESGIRFNYELFVDGNHVYAEDAHQVRRMRNGLGVLHIYFKALLYSYLLLFVLVFVAVIAGVSSSIIGQASPPEEGVWWFPIIAVFVALLSYGLLFYFTRRRRFWAIFRDVFSRRTKLTGQVTETTSKTTEGQYTTTEHFVIVRDESFPVFGKIYNWVWKGDEVVVCYWPHSKTVAWIEKME